MNGELFFLTVSIWLVFWFIGWAIGLATDSICAAIRAPREVVLRFEDDEFGDCCDCEDCDE